MAIYLGRWGWGLGLAGVLLWGEANLLGSSLLAQITPDATLGAENSVVTPNVNVRGFPAERIDGGAVRGANLFHSFQEFNVGNGQRVYFANPTGIENILSRVTGNNLSNILGILGVDGGANLFLLNPNGIIFGSNAQLDIAGSFVASTANSVVFDNGFEFNAKNPATPPLLTVNVPLGVQYGTNQPRTTITNTGNLAVGQNLTLDAGNLDLQGQLQSGNNLTLQAQDTVKIRDSVTNPFIAAAGGKLLVQGNQFVDIFALNHPNSGLYSGGDMVLRSANTISGDAYYWSGGNFRVEKLDGSLGDLESPSDPVFEVAGDYNVANYTGASLQILAGGSVNIPGTITINGAGGAFNNSTVTLSDGTPLTISGTIFPTVDIRAGTTTFFDIPTPGTPTSANITIGGIQINAANGLVFLTNQYQPNTLPGNIQVRRIRTGPGGLFPFSGNSGDIIMDSRGDIIIPEPNPNAISTIRTDTNNDKAGDITLIANGSFFMRGGAQLAALSLQTGNAGNINIFVQDSVFLTEGAQLATLTFGSGNAGNINIVAGNAVSFANGSFISAETRGLTGGNAGNIHIRAGLLSIDNSALQANTRGQGNASSITIDVNRLDLMRGGLVFTGSSGTGKAGDISITATDTVNVSQAFAITGSTGAGDSGNLSIRTGQLNVGDGGQLSTVSAAQGDAGNLSIEATDSVNVGNLGFLITGTGESSTGKSGNLSINTGTLNVSGGGQVTTASRGTENAGNLAIAATNSVNVNSQGLITTSSIGLGDSGNLSINTKQFNLSGSGSVVNTNALGGGKAGDLFVTNADTVTVSNQGLLSTGSQGAGDAGILSIQTRQLDVVNSGINGGISTVALGTGNSGNLSAVATDSINVLSGGNILTFAAQGSSGKVDLTTSTLRIRDNSSVLSSSFGGDAGDFTVIANSIEVANGSKLSANTFGSGTGGNVLLDTRTLSVLNGGEVSSVVTDTGSGNAGTITVQNANSIEVDGAKIATETYGRGNAGALTIETGTLAVRNGGEVSTGVYLNSSGNGGKLSVNSTDSVDLNGGSLVTLTVGSGAAGDLEVNTRRLTAPNGGRVEARTASLSPGGTVTVNASESIELIGNSGSGTNQPAAISALSDNNSLGNAPSGNIILNTGELIIRDGAEVTTATLGRGEGGDIRVQANSLSLSNNGNITTRSTGQVNAGNAGDINLTLQGNLRSNGGIISATSEQAGGGDINISADDIRLRDGSLISTSVFDSTGGGGNIAIDSTVFLAIEDSDILANAEAGPGGNIIINSSAFLADLFSSGAAVPVGRNPGDLAQFRGNGRNDISVSAAFRGNDRVDISADSRTGTSGTVIIRGSFSERRVNPLPSWVDAEELIDRRCSPQNSAKASSFTITGRGGLPPNPNDPLTNQDVLVDWITLEDREEAHHRETLNPNPTAAHPTQLVEAQSWVMGSEGQVILTAAAPTVTPASSGLVVPSCEDNESTTD